MIRVDADTVAVSTPTGRVLVHLPAPEPEEREPLFLTVDGWPFLIGERGAS